jgi:ketosteroid isomerase-like protein
MTSPRDPIEVVRTLYDLFSSGRLDETYAIMASDVVLFEPGDPGLLPWAGRFEGHEGLRRFYGGLAEGLTEIAIDPTSLSIQRISDTEVLATGIERATARRTSKTYETHSAWVWTVQNGRVTHLRAYHDTAAMALALSP